MPDPGNTKTTVVGIADDGHEMVLGYVDAPRPDVVLVDTLLRLQLRARRQGWRLGLREVSPDLLGLLELVGLDGVLVLEPRREAELAEQLGVEEVVQPGDLPA